MLRGVEESELVVGKCGSRAAGDDWFVSRNPRPLLRRRTEEAVIV